MSIFEARKSLKGILNKNIVDSQELDRFMMEIDDMSIYEN